MISDKNKFKYTFVTDVTIFKRVQPLKKLLFLLYLPLCLARDLFRLFRKVNFYFKKSFNDYVIIIESFNNLRALEFLFHKLDTDAITIISKSSKIIEKSDYKDFYNEIVWSQGIRLKWLIEKYSFLFSILFSKKFSNWNFRGFENSYYFFSMFSELLAMSELKNTKVITSNDINVFSRSILYHCNLNSIKNVYIQHASVSSIFPKLTNTLAILYGEYSKDIYRKNENVQIELVGNHLFDNRKDLTNKKKNSISNLKFKNIVVGIGYNPIDDLHKVSTLINKLHNELPFVNIVVRAHPRDSRILSNSGHFILDKNVDVFDFFDQIDVLIAGISGIILEAALVNVYPITYDFVDKEKTGKGKESVDLDYYDYIKNKISILLNDKEIISFISSVYKGDIILEPTRPKCTYYDASIGSDWEFNTTSKMVELIKRI